MQHDEVPCQRRWITRNVDHISRAQLQQQLTSFQTRTRSRRIENYQRGPLALNQSLLQKVERRSRHRTMRCPNFLEGHLQIAGR